MSDALEPIRQQIDAIDADEAVEDAEADVEELADTEGVAEAVEVADADEAETAEAVEAVKRTPYDLVFMDWLMPGMDGFKATEAIREWEKEAGTRVPIVAMTACAMEGDRQRGLDGGMDDYLTKPVRFEELDSILDRWLAPGPDTLAAGWWSPRMTSRSPSTCG